VVSDGSTLLAGAAEAGDEPVMLARALPGVVVAVGTRRDVVGRAVEARFGRGACPRRRLPAPASRAGPRPRLPRRARPRGPADARGAPARAALGPRPGRPRPADPGRGRDRGRAAHPRAQARSGPDVPRRAPGRGLERPSTEPQRRRPPGRSSWLPSPGRSASSGTWEGAVSTWSAAPGSATTTASARMTSPGWRNRLAPPARRRS